MYRVWLGGAAGGGKSDALLMAAIIFALSFNNSKTGFFRRKYVQLEGPGGAIMRSAELIPSNLAKYNQQRKRWTFANGSILQFCHLEHENTVYDYQSQSFDLICLDEATHFTRFQYSYMKTRNRSNTPNVKRPFMLLATNPGNIGHAWFRSEFVDIGEPEKPHEVEVEEGKKETHVFIPALLSDNQALEERDPEYRKNLENQPEHIRRQLLEGDWDVAEGVAFTEWNKKYHVCEPFKIPDSWIKFRAYDHGYVKPYAVGWFAIDHDGRLYMYRELYPYEGQTDKGSQETPAEIADKIMRLEAEDKNIQYAIADDAIFGGKQDNSPSIAEQFAQAFGSNARHWSPVGKGPRSRIQGKLEVHHRLRVPKDDKGEPSGVRPMIVFFNTCVHTIRTLPNLVLDEKNPEDIDTTLEDHLYDMVRYACMSRPIATPEPKQKETRIQKHKRMLQQKRKEQRRIL